MFTEPTNDERAERAHLAILAYVGDLDREFHMGDLMGDLMHWAERESARNPESMLLADCYLPLDLHAGGYDVEEMIVAYLAGAVTNGEMHYTEERAEEAENSDDA